MRWREEEQRYLVRLYPGDEIIESLETLSRDTGLEGASVSGIGALETAELGYFDRASGEYQTRHYRGGFELVSLQGNMSICDGRPKVHLHVCLGDREMNLFGGHLAAGVVSVTGELEVRRFAGKLTREIDPATELPLWNLE